MKKKRKVEIEFLSPWELMAYEQGENLKRVEGTKISIMSDEELSNIDATELDERSRRQIFLEVQRRLGLI